MAFFSAPYFPSTVCDFHRFDYPSVKFSFLLTFLTLNHRSSTYLFVSFISFFLDEAQFHKRKKLREKGKKKKRFIESKIFPESYTKKGIGHTQLPPPHF